MHNHWLLNLTHLFNSTFNLRFAQLIEDLDLLLQSLRFVFKLPEFIWKLEQFHFWTVVDSELETNSTLALVL